MGESELRLIQRALNRDMEAWAEIMNNYKRAVFGVSLGILKNVADAEDTTQEAFIRAYEKLHTYNMQKKFSTWLFTVAANLCKNKLRRAKFSTALKSESMLVDERDPAMIAAQDEMQQKVRKALDNLRYDYRAPMVLRFYADLDYKEIAEVLDVPEGTIKTRLHRGKQELRRLLEQEGGLEHGRQTA
jgi:RNA polymerase sigma-70 factor (ECF subfamily)